MNCAKKAWDEAGPGWRKQMLERSRARNRPDLQYLAFDRLPESIRGILVRARVGEDVESKPGCKDTKTQVLERINCAAMAEKCERVMLKGGKESQGSRTAGDPNGQMPIWTAADTFLKTAAENQMRDPTWMS